MTSHHDHHGALDGGLAGGILGHEGHGVHTERDAAIGGIAGHEMEKKHEHHEGDAASKPSIGDKISGKVEEIIGKVTNKPDKVVEGKIKQAGGAVGK